MAIRDTLVALIDKSKTDPLVSPVTVPLPGWPDPVYVRRIKSSELLKAYSKIPEEYITGLVMYCLANEDGTRVFQDTETDLVKELHPAALAILFGNAAEFNQLNPSDEKKSSNETASPPG